MTTLTCGQYAHWKSAFCGTGLHHATAGAAGEFLLGDFWGSPEYPANLAFDPGHGPVSDPTIRRHHAIGHLL